MTLTDYILNRILALKAETPDGIWTEESEAQRKSRIDELENLLAVISSTAMKAIWGTMPEI